MNEEPPRPELPQPPASGSGGQQDGFDLSLFWRNSTLWPVTFCAVVGLSALGAGAVSMALTQRNPFAKAALAVAAAMTAFGMWDLRSRKGKLGGGAVLAAVMWALSIGGGVVLARTGN
jgi:hypothetical protein